MDDDDLLIFFWPPPDEDAPAEPGEDHAPSISRRADAAAIRWRRIWTRRAVITFFAAFPTTLIGAVLVWSVLLAPFGLVVLFGGAAPFAYCVYRAAGGGPPGIEWRPKKQHGGRAG